MNSILNTHGIQIGDRYRLKKPIYLSRDKLTTISSNLTDLAAFSGEEFCIMKFDHDGVKHTTTMYNDEPEKIGELVIIFAHYETRLSGRLRYNIFKEYFDRI